ncbi:hypothetical protein ScPMuIL_007682 [Solemya velum]
MWLDKYLVFPDELFDFIKIRFGYGKIFKKRADYSKKSEEMKYCYECVRKTLPGFSSCQEALQPEEVSDAVGVVGSIMRALDEIEDDTTIPAVKRRKMLKEFYTYLEDPGWCYPNCKSKFPKYVREFPKISAAYRSLPPEYRAPVSKLIEVIGVLMGNFIDFKFKTVEEMLEYQDSAGAQVCVHVAKIISVADGEDYSKKIEAGLNKGFKLVAGTLTVRDYYEDAVYDHLKWPSEMLDKYCKDPLELLDKKNRKSAIHLLNEMVTVQMEIIPEFLPLYKDCTDKESWFQYTSIPPAVAFAILDMAYNTACSFRPKNEFRLGALVKVAEACYDLDGTMSVYHYYAKKIHGRVQADDPNAERTKNICKQIMEIAQTERVFNPVRGNIVSTAITVGTIAMGIAALF